MTWRALLPAVAIAGVVIAVAMTDPVPQDPLYYLFADERSMSGIPNFLNVVSNLPFLVVGILGWRLLAKHPETTPPHTRRAWTVFFFGIALIAFGSGYFHLRPDGDSLVWDRLPMTIAFMSLVSVVVSEYFSAILGERLLLPLLLAGTASVAYWAYTESIGAGDLRPYAVVQFLPMLLIPLVISLYGRRSDLSPYLWWMLACYVAAKIAEHYDADVYRAGRIVSGHSLKHLAAALAPAGLLYGLMRRRAGG